MSYRMTKFKKAIKYKCNTEYNVKYYERKIDWSKWVHFFVIFEMSHETFRIRSVQAQINWCYSKQACAPFVWCCKKWKLVFFIQCEKFIVSFRWLVFFRYLNMGYDGYINNSKILVKTIIFFRVYLCSRQL